jgi:hypothetical protein
VFEKIIVKPLQGFISANKILPDHQFGFRMAHSTSHQLRRVVRHVKGKKEPPLSESKGMLLLEVKKAFDSVWHMRLLFINILEGAVTSLWLGLFSLF